MTEKNYRTTLSKAGLFLILALIIAGFALLLCRYWEPAIITPDANGYWAQGTLIADTGNTWFKPQSDTQYIGIHWLVNDKGKYFCRYPPGLPIMIAGLYRSLGLSASILLNPILSVLTLIGMFLLLRSNIGKWWAVLGTLFLAATPLMVQQSIWCFAHAAVTFLLVWALYFLFLWQKTQNVWILFISALFFGIIPSVRYPEGIFIITFIVFVLLCLKGIRKKWLHLLSGAAGISLPIIPILIRNHYAFGKFYLTGYSLTQEQTGFSLSNLRSNLPEYIKSFNTVGLGLLFVIGLAGMITMIVLKETRKRGIALTVTSLLPVIVYSLYYWSGRGDDVSSLRFFLPIFICFIFSGVWFLEYLFTRKNNALKTVTVILIILQLAWSAFLITSTDRQLKLLKYKKAILVQITESLEDNIEKDSVVIAHPEILQHLDFVRKWKLAEIIAIPVNDKRDDIPLFDEDEASPMQKEKMELRIEKYEGLKPLEIERLVAEDISGWADGSKVFFILTKEQLSRLKGRIFRKDSLRIFYRIELPQNLIPSLENPGPEDKTNSITQANKDLFWQSLTKENEIFLVYWKPKPFNY